MITIGHKHNTEIPWRKGGSSNTVQSTPHISPSFKQGHHTKHCKDSIGGCATILKHPPAPQCRSVPIPCACTATFRPATTRGNHRHQGREFVAIQGLGRPIHQRNRQISSPQHSGDCSAIPPQLGHLNAQLFEVLEPLPAGQSEKKRIESATASSKMRTCDAQPAKKKALAVELLLPRAQTVALRKIGEEKNKKHPQTHARAPVSLPVRATEDIFRFSGR